MKKYLLFFLVLLMVSSCASIKATLFYPPSLKDVSKKPIGVAIDSALALNDATYKELLLSEFNSITPENAMKMENILLQPNRYDFSKADFLVQFAIQNNLRFRAHPLVWHRQVPAWIAEMKESEIIDLYSNYIEKLVNRYRARVYSWDVVNEAFLSDGSFRNSIWFLLMGPEYISQAFKLARKNDPQAKLFYNDYGLENFGPKFDAVYSFLKKLKVEGVPIDGIGLQAHLKTNSNIEQFEEVIKKFSDLGLQVEITEFDVALKNSSDDMSERKQIEIFSKVTKICSSTAKCGAITFWGLGDANSWIEKELPGYGRASLFDKNYQKKQSYYNVMDAL